MIFIDEVIYLTLYFSATMSTQLPGDIHIVGKVKKTRRLFSEEENRRITECFENGGSIKDLATSLNRTCKCIKDHYESYIRGMPVFTEEENKILMSYYPKFGQRFKLYKRIFPKATSINIRDEIKRTLKARKEQANHKQDEGVFDPDNDDPFPLFDDPFPIFDDPFL